uniref:Carbohydrate kinase PfkB domain-containing protein n=1 Tax=Octactis speculum TaxID=3111310 RepID=A0A7S2B303_9STRA
MQSPKTLDAKLKVKSDIWGSWSKSGFTSKLDHQVKVMYTEFIGDEKRDMVEYTALGLLGSPWTMLTYTRAMDSILCVPLIVDAAAWCECFTRLGVSPSAAQLALSYLFKVPQARDADKPHDPGFFTQMRSLEDLLSALSSAESDPVGPEESVAKKRETTVSSSASDVDVVEEEATVPGGAMSVPPRPPFSSVDVDGGVICAGLACLDMELVGADRSPDVQTVNSFERIQMRAGGSAPQTTAALGRLGIPAVCVARVGQDSHGTALRQLLRDEGAQAESDGFMVSEDAGVGTSVAVLPVYTDGKRGCYVDLAANTELTVEHVLDGIKSATENRKQGYRALHFGYPHLLPHCSGRGLATLLTSARRIIQGGRGDDCLVSVDLNGVTPENEKGKSQVLTTDALRQIDLLHASEGEAALICGEHDRLLGPFDDAFCERVAAWAHKRGVAILCLTLGEKGCFVSTTPSAARLRRVRDDWPPGVSMRCPAFKVGQVDVVGSSPATAKVNANGAGDTFCAAFIAGLLWKHRLSLDDVIGCAALAALHRVDTDLRDAEEQWTMARIVDAVTTGAIKRLETLEPLA